MLNPIRFLRRLERISRDADEEAMVMRRRHGPAAYEQLMDKLARDDLTRRYRKVLEKAAARLRD